MIYAEFSHLKTGIRFGVITQDWTDLFELYSNVPHLENIVEPHRITGIQEVKNEKTSLSK